MNRLPNGRGSAKHAITILSRARQQADIWYWNAQA
jgi:hypothetical protein